MAKRGKILREARKQGIVDVDPVSLETLKLATKLMKKHGPHMYKDLEERRERQKKE